MRELVKRSNGVFGKSGTGKTFLTRLLLAGILQSGEATNLVFDMESEYGWRGYSEANLGGEGPQAALPVQGSRSSRSTRRARGGGGLTPDYVVRIGYEEIEPEDIEILRETLGLSEVAADAAYSLHRHFGASSWLREFLSTSGRQTIFELADSIGVNGNALGEAAHRLTRLRRFGFIDETAGTTRSTTS